MGNNMPLLPPSRSAGHACSRQRSARIPRSARSLCMQVPCVVSQALAYAADRKVDRAIEQLGLAPLGQVQKLITGEHALLGTNPGPAQHRLDPGEQLARGKGFRDSRGILSRGRRSDPSHRCGRPASGPVRPCAFRRGGPDTPSSPGITMSRTMRSARSPSRNDGTWPPSATTVTRSPNLESRSRLYERTRGNAASVWRLESPK